MTNFKKEWWEYEGTIKGILTSPLAFIAGGPVGFLGSIAVGAMCDALDTRDKKKEREEAERKLQLVQNEPLSAEEYARIREWNNGQDRLALTELEKFIRAHQKIEMRDNAMKTCGDYDMMLPNLPTIVYMRNIYAREDIYKHHVGFSWNPIGLSSDREDSALVFKRSSLFLEKLKEDCEKEERIFFYIPKRFETCDAQFLYNTAGDKTWRVYERQPLLNISNREFNF